MIFVDTSALIAILVDEPDADFFVTKLETANGAICAGHVILEASMRLSTLLGITPTIAERLVLRLLHEAAISVVPITTDIAHLAVVAFERFGKGRGHDARLNFGDCLSYACAEAHGAGLLFKGDDFTKTDISVA